MDVTILIKYAAQAASDYLSITQNYPYHCYWLFIILIKARSYKKINPSSYLRDTSGKFYNKRSVKSSFDID